MADYKNILNPHTGRLTKVLDAESILDTDAYLTTQVTQKIYVDGARTDSYTPNGSITKPYKTITNALNSITDNAYEKQYVIDVAPYIYNEQITLKSFIYLEGHGEDATRIKYNDDVVIAPTSMGWYGSSLFNLSVECSSIDISKCALRVQNAGSVGISKVNLYATKTGIICEGGYFLAKESGILSGTDAIQVQNGAYVFLRDFEATSGDDPNWDLNIVSGGYVWLSSGCRFYYSRINNLGTIDYVEKASLIDNDSSVTGDTVKDALETLDSKNLEDLTDIQFDSGTPTDGQVLTYDTVSGKWKAEDPSSGGDIPVTKILYVDSERIDAYTEDGSLNKPYKTITSANAVASAGDIIYVLAGTYSANITTVQGVIYYAHTGHYNTSKVIMTGTFGIAVDDVYIIGFDFQSPTSHAVQVLNTSIDNLHILKNRIYNAGNDPILFNSTPTVAHTNIYINDNYIEKVDGASDSGIWFYHVTGGEIKNNIIWTIGYNGIIADGIQNVIISGNDFRSCGQSGIQIANSPSSNTIVENNYFYNNNTASSSDKGGIAIYPNTDDLKIRYNIFDSNYNGFSVRDKVGTTNSDVLVNYNEFINSANYGIQNLAQSGGNLNAKWNWFGDSSGCDDDDGVINGTGDKITTNVVAEPFKNYGNRATDIRNDSSVSGSTVKDALDELDSNILWENISGGVITPKSINIIDINEIQTSEDLLINCGTNKTLKLDKPVYKDINLASSMLNLPVATQPDEVQIIDKNGANTGMYTWGFDIDESVSGIFEIQHDYKEGTDLSFHIHWGGNDAPTGTDYVKWELTYTLVRDFNVFDAVTIKTIESSYDTQYEWIRSDFPVIDGTNIKIGDQLFFKIKRITADGDTYSGDALVATLGVHYQVDTIGSREITTK